MPKVKLNKKYTGKFKHKIMETMIKEKLSYCKTAREFRMISHHMVGKWEQIYLEEGAE